MGSIASSIAWRWEKPPLTSGILACCDAHQEWLLPWWWERLQAVGSYPVAFVDFGMSEEGLAFCKAHGMLLTLDEKVRVASREEVEPRLVAAWEKRYGSKVWHARNCWFLKPFALLQTPFLQTLYLDLDCEVIHALDILHAQTDLMAMREPYDPTVKIEELPEGESLYNSGVFLYRHGTDYIPLWAERGRRENHCYCGDDNLLSHLICSEGWKIEELPTRFHVRPLRGVPLDATIIHWAGTWGKNLIRDQGGLKETLSSVLPVRHLERRLWHVE